MKKILLPLFLGIATLAMSQPKYDGLEIVQGPMFSVDKRSVPTRFVGHDKSGFFIEYSKGKFGQGDLIIQKFGYDLKPIAERDLGFKSDNGPAESWIIFKMGGKYYSCSSAGLVDTKSFYLQEINTTDLSLGAPTHLATVNPEGINASNATYRFAFSKDSSYASLIYSIPTKRADMEQLGVVVFDRDMTPIWNKTFELPYTNKFLDTQKYMIDYQGNLYVLAKRYFNERRKDTVGGEVNYDFLLLNLKSDGQLDSINMKSEGKYLRGMNVDVSPTGEIISGGFYSDKNSLMTGGVFYMKINDTTKEVLTTSFKELDIEFFIANMKERQAEKLKEKIEDGKDVELPYYYIDEFRTSKDGTTQMIGEKRQVIVRHVYTAYGSYTYYDYYWDDIAVVQVSPNGEINWAQRIAKKQHTTNDNAAYSSYGAMFRANETIFFFNDNAKNALYDGVGKVAPMVKGEDNLLMMVRMDKDGNMKRTGLMRQGDADIRMRPIFSHQLNENEFLIFGHKDVKSQRFILMKFE